MGFKGIVDKLSGQAGKSKLVSMAFASDGINIAKRQGGDVVGWSCDMLAANLYDQKAVSRYVKDNKLNHCKAVAVLSPDHYSLHYMSRPNVPAAELKQAMRWQLADRLHYPIDEAVIETFESPVLGDENGGLYVAAARAADVRRYIDLLEIAGLRLAVVTIPEVALGRLGSTVLGSEGVNVVLRLTPDQARILVLKNGQILVSRLLEITELSALRAALTAHGDDVELPASLVDALRGRTEETLEYVTQKTDEPLPAYVHVLGNTHAALSNLVSQMNVDSDTQFKLLDVPGKLGVLGAESAISVGAMEAVGAGLGAMNDDSAT